MTLASNSASSFSSLFSSLRFGIKRSSKPELTENINIGIYGYGNTLSTQDSPASKGRRQALSLDFSADEHSKILEELLQFQQQNESAEAKKRHGLLAKRKSFSKSKHSSVYNNDESLQNAVLVGNIELTRQVLQNENVDINALQSPGWTVLHHACRLGHLKMIILLLEFGADTSLVNEEGLTPLLIAVTNGNFDAAACLIHDGGVSCAEVRDGFQEAISYRRNSETRPIYSTYNINNKLKKTKSTDSSD